MANVLQITPFMHVRDLEEAVAFFTEVLGFTVPYRLRDYAYIEREGAAIRILEARDAPVATRASRRFTYYIDVRDVDSLYRELKPRLATLPAGDVDGPADKDYGQRELLVVVPDGQILAFGQGIRR